MPDEASHPSFEDVATELSSPLQHYLERLSGDRSTAEDLLQETLLKIARALPGFEGRSSVKTWAFSIATRVAADHYRRPENRVRIVDVDDAAEPGDPDVDVDDRLGRLPLQQPRPIFDPRGEIAEVYCHAPGGTRVRLYSAGRRRAITPAIAQRPVAGRPPIQSSSRPKDRI